MNIKRAKQEIKDSIEAYLTKDNYGEYKIPSIRQRPILLMGPPGIGKTQIMEQIARECEIGLVAYTITHHTRQSAIGLPLTVLEASHRHKTVSMRLRSISKRCRKQQNAENSILTIHFNKKPLKMQTRNIFRDFFHIFKNSC